MGKKGLQVGFDQIHDQGYSISDFVETKKNSIEGEKTVKKYLLKQIVQKINRWLQY